MRVFVRPAITSVVHRWLAERYLVKNAQIIPFNSLSKQSPTYVFRIYSKLRCNAIIECIGESIVIRRPMPHESSMLSAIPLILCLVTAIPIILTQSWPYHLCLSIATSLSVYWLSREPTYHFSFTRLEIYDPDFFPKLQEELALRGIKPKPGWLRLFRS